MTKDIFTPCVGESVQIGQQTNSFSVNISDELLASLKISQVGFTFFILHGRGVNRLLL